MYSQVFCRRCRKGNSDNGKVFYTKEWWSNKYVKVVNRNIVDFAEIQIVDICNDCRQDTFLEELSMRIIQVCSCGRFNEERKGWRYSGLVYREEIERIKKGEVSNSKVVKAYCDNCENF